MPKFVLLLWVKFQAAHYLKHVLTLLVLILSHRNTEPLDRSGIRVQAIRSRSCRRHQRLPPGHLLRLRPQLHLRSGAAKSPRNHDQNLRPNAETAVQIAASNDPQSADVIPAKEIEFVADRGELPSAGQCHRSSVGLVRRVSLSVGSSHRLDNEAGGSREEISPCC